MVTQFYSLKNNTLGLVQNNPLLSVGTNLVVDSTLDAKLNGMTYPLFLTIWGANGLTPDTDPNVEIVEITARASANNYTIARGQENTTGAQHNFGDNIGLLLTAGEILQTEVAINNLENFRDVTLPANIQNQAYIYADDTGSTNTYAIAPSPSIIAYAKGQKFSFKVANGNSGASTLNVNGKGAVAIKKNKSSDLVSGDILSGQMVEVEHDGIYFQMVSPVSTYATARFGGSGVDGALNISSGVTNLDCGGSLIFVKNYTSISITGTASLTFSNPHANGTIVVIKSQGDVVITSSTGPAITLNNMGGAIGTNGHGLVKYTLVGAGGGIHNTPSISGKFLNLYTGAGGGNGSGAWIPGAGGRGSGSLYIECGGNWNVTSNISLVGTNGNNGAGGGSSNEFASGGPGGSSKEDGGSPGNAYITSPGGGGGGGGGGVFIGIYNGSLIANSGNVSVSGGSGGTPFGAAGGDGYSLVVANTEFL
jgi:hypothetical protein